MEAGGVGHLKKPLGTNSIGELQVPDFFTHNFFGLLAQGFTAPNLVV
jgi:hypothetical protein